MKALINTHGYLRIPIASALSLAPLLWTFYIEAMEWKFIILSWSISKISLLLF